MTMVKDSAKEYHSKMALSASYMKLLKACPAKFSAAIDRPQKPSAEMIFGSYFHSIVLEPDTVDLDYAILKEDGRTKAGKEEKKKAEDLGKTIVSISDSEMAQEMKNSVEKNVIWQGITQNNCSFFTEQSFYWEEDTEVGDKIPCKARMDGLFISNTGAPFIVDLKTTKDSSPDAVVKTIASFQYHIQAAWYIHCAEIHGFDNPRMLFFFIEKQYPYICTPVELSAEAIQVGMSECEYLKEKFAHCIRTNFEQDYINSGEILKVDLPSWYQTNIQPIEL